MKLLSTFFSRLKAKKKAKDHKKAVLSVLDKMNPESPNFDKKYFNETRKKFNDTFGANTAKRTQVQWKNLVNTYGIDVVCEKEGMTKEQVMKFCNETRAQRNVRLSRENNRINERS